jgi:hypothetical protein
MIFISGGSLAIAAKEMTMGFFFRLRDHFTNALHHRPILHDDPLLGAMEEIGNGFWRTTDPVEFGPTGEPVNVVLEADDDGSDTHGRAAFAELQNRYDRLQSAISPVICIAAPRARMECLWARTTLSLTEIWHGKLPGDPPIIALHYQLDDDPEYTYVVRLENWRPVDVVVAN